MWQLTSADAVGGLGTLAADPAPAGLQAGGFPDLLESLALHLHSGQSNSPCLKGGGNDPMS